MAINKKSKVIKYIGPKGYSILKSSLSITEQHELREELTVKPQFKD